MKLRKLHGRTEIRNFSSSVEIFFNTRRELRISKRLCNVLILFFAAKGALYHMLFFTGEDMACLVRKLTSYFIGVYIISSGNVIKFKLFLHPLQSNHEHLFLQGEECLYLNTGDMVSDTQDLIDTKAHFHFLIDLFHTLLLFVFFYMYYNLAFLTLLACAKYKRILTFNDSGQKGSFICISKNK